MPKCLQKTDIKYNRSNGTGHCKKVTQEARQQRLEDRSVSHETLIEKLRVSEGGAKMPYQVTRPT